MIKINYLDLFSGIGGFTEGIRQAKVEFNNHYYSEVDKYAIQIYQRHFPNAIGLGDVRNITRKALGQIDLITFGFPCQDLSVAGKRAGLEGKRSGLFYESIRIIQEYEPSVFIFENVKGLFSSHNGKDFEIVLQEIANLGIYECEWQLINTSWFLPQNRERVYFIGHLRGQGGAKVFPIFSNNKDDACSYQETQRTRKRFWNTNTEQIHEEKHDIMRSGQKQGTSITDISETHKLPDALRVRDIDNCSVTLKSEGGGLGAKTGLYCIASRGGRPGKQGQQVEIRQDADKKTNSITSVKKDNYIADESNIRRLTPTECCRLQGFPDDWCDGISDSQKYRCLGNAVSVPVAKEIASRLYNTKGGL